MHGTTFFQHPKTQRPARPSATYHTLPTLPGLSSLCISLSPLIPRFLFSGLYPTQRDLVSISFCHISRFCFSHSIPLEFHSLPFLATSIAAVLGTVFRPWPLDDPVPSALYPYVLEPSRSRRDASTASQNATAAKPPRSQPLPRRYGSSSNTASSSLHDQ